MAKGNPEGGKREAKGAAKGATECPKESK